MRLTLLFTPDGARAFYNDRLMDAVRGESTEIARLSTIEPENGQWVVRDSAGAPLFTHKFRDACLAYEHQHAVELLKEHAHARRGLLGVEHS